MHQNTSTLRTALMSTLTALALTSVSAAAVAQTQPSLESLVGSERFRATGLGKLNAAEQAELARWLQSRGIEASPAAGAATAAAADDDADEALRASLQEAQRVREELAAEIAAAKAATEAMREKRDAAMAAADAAEARQAAAENEARTANEETVESRLREPFTGWSGKTVFQLENGQVWRQRLPGRYVHRDGDLPRVRISKNVMGYYDMELTGYDRKIGVSRIR